MTDEGRIHFPSGANLLFEIGMNKGMLPSFGWMLVACSPNGPHFLVLAVKYAVLVVEIVV